VRYGECCINTAMRYIDSHNHLQDERFTAVRRALASRCAEIGVVASVVNGAHPDDWPDVAVLAAEFSWVIPSFGVHPWYINDLPTDWFERLEAFLDSTPSAIGETGIDGWRKEFDPDLQERIFIRQLELAAARNVPISIHGLRRWGRLLEILQKHPRPACGFILHSYGGPREMVQPFARLGGYFSCPGFFLKPGREMKLAVFKDLPSDRLLLETDAPDQNLPEELDSYKLSDPKVPSVRVNHPANISQVYEGVAMLRGVTVGELAIQVEQNFARLFGELLTKRATHLPNA
jgi:TatD DNase family protein